MRILTVHNRYQQPGGEDEVFRAEAELLERYGNTVSRLVFDNRDIPEGRSLFGSLNLAGSTIWSRRSAARMSHAVRRLRPDVVHFHNTFPLISPAAYYACRKMGVPVVQSLHNPRLLCPAATFYRDGHVCVDCLGKAIPWPGILHACYHESRGQTAVVAAMLGVHRYLGTWEDKVDIYIVFSEFYRQKFIAGGLPEERVVVKPHFVHPDPGPRQGQAGDYAAFVGRLDAEKGVHTLLRAWRQLPQVPLRIRGGGNLLGEVKRAIEAEYLSALEVVGRLPREDLVQLVKGARFLVWPSEGFYETFGLVAIEAFACGVPVIASRLGVMAEITQDGETGLHFVPGDANDLAVKVEWAWSHPQELRKMGERARCEYEAKYTAARNYAQLMEIYERAIAVARGRGMA